MSLIFINYRREDGYEQARRMYDWLNTNLGPGQVFIDSESIDPGDDWQRFIDNQIQSSRIFLALIGEKWSSASDSDGQIRLDKPSDVLRREILIATNVGIRIIPILLNDVAMPQPRDLPPELHPLVKREALRVRHQVFEEDMRSLLAHIERFSLAFPVSSIVKKKVCMLGATGVGKTSLVQRFVSNFFSESYLTTVGVKIERKQIRIGEREIVLMVWDMAGEEEGSPIREDRLRGADTLILVADGCSRASLDAALHMRSRFQHGDRNAVVVINKADLHKEWKITEDTLTALDRSGLTTFTTSAKTGKGVEEMFHHVARKILEREDN
jgi:small GTP-binding protein